MSFYNFTLNKSKSLEAVLKVQVAKDEVNKFYKDNIKYIKANAKFPGFRKGKVTDDVVRKKYSKNLEKSVSEQLMKSAWEEFFKTNKDERPFTNPKQENISTLTEGNNFSFEFHFEAFPDISLPSLTKLNLEIELPELDEEQRMKEVIAQITQGQTKYEEIEQSATQDMIVEIDYNVILAKNLKLPEEASKLLEGKGHWIPMKEDISILPEVHKNLLGTKVNDQKSWEFTYPKEYSFVKELAGKKATVTAKVLKVRKAVVPELNDDIAKQMGAENVELLKKNIVDNIQNEYKTFCETKRCETLLDKLIDKAKITLPKKTLERQIEALEKENDKKEEKEKKSVKDVKKNAEQALTKHFISSEIIRLEKVELNQEELSAELMKIAQMYRIPMEQLQKNKEYLQFVAGQILERKALAKLLEKCEFKEKFVKEENKNDK